MNVSMESAVELHLFDPNFSLYPIIAKLFKRYLEQNFQIKDTFPSKAIFHFSLRDWFDFSNFQMFQMYAIKGGRF